MANTFAPGVSVTVRLLKLKQDNVTVAALGATDIMTVRVFALNGTQHGEVYTNESGAIVGDGAGNYVTHIVTPTPPGTYYVQWDFTIGTFIGQQTYTFQVRNRIG